MHVGNGIVAGAQILRRQLAWIGDGAAIADLVAAAVGEGKRRIAAADAGEFGRKVRDTLGDQVNDAALALDTVVYFDNNRTVALRYYEATVSD